MAQRLKTGRQPASGTGQGMAFHQSWGAEGLDPSVRERGASATQRTGAPGDWMNAPAQRQLSPHEARDIAEIHQRLDSIARQVEQLSQHPAARGENGVARQLNDAISRLDARLSHMSAPSQQVPYAAAPRMAPPARLSSGWPTTRAGSKTWVMPRPSQVGQAPTGELKENRRGSSSGSE